MSQTSFNCDKQLNLKMILSMIYVQLLQWTRWKTVKKHIQFLIYLQQTEK